MILDVGGIIVVMGLGGDVLEMRAILGVSGIISVLGGAVSVTGGAVAVADMSILEIGRSMLTIIIFVVICAQYNSPTLFKTMLSHGLVRNFNCVPTLILKAYFSWFYFYMYSMQFDSERIKSVPLPNNDKVIIRLIIKVQCLGIQ